MLAKPIQSVTGNTGSKPLQPFKAALINECSNTETYLIYEPTSTPDAYPTPIITVATLFDLA